MARRLGARKDPLPRRVVFMTYSAEERGLIGSAHYVSHPLYPLDKTVMMVNFDMVGRLNDKNTLLVYGTGSAPGLDAIVDALGKSEGFNVRKFADGSGGGDARYFAASDHYSFWRKDIPVLFFFTGVHGDYHRPSDDTPTINFAGMARIADLGELILLDVARRPERPEFTRRNAAQNAHSGGAKLSNEGARNEGGRSRAAYLGAVPDYGGEDEAKGVKIAEASKGSPAEKAGVKAGDVLVKLGGRDVKTLEDYAAAIQAHKPGDAVQVVVRRDGKDVTLDVTLGARGSAAK
jgi:hypothetical protein